MKVIILVLCVNLSSGQIRSSTDEPKQHSFFSVNR